MAVPSAVPTTGLFSSCNFTDRDSLLSMVDSDGQRFNISLLAQACPQLCPLAYGTGNPDMTGIGVSISYLLQGITTIILGPLLGGLVIFFKLENAEPPELKARLYEAAGNIAYSAAKINMFLSFSLLIAALIRLAKAPPIDEYAFLQSLAELQTCVVTGAIASLSPYRSLRSYAVPLLMIYWAVFVLVGQILPVVASLSSTHSGNLDRIASYCLFQQDGFLDPSTTFLRESSRRRRIFTSPSPSMVDRIAIFAMMSIIGIVSQIIVLSRGLYAHTPVGRAFLKACNVLWRAVKHPLVRVMMIVFLSLVWLFCTVVLLWGIGFGRQRLQELSGSLYQDSQWGYGQITAILAWTPLVLDIVLEITRLLFPWSSGDV